MFIALRASRESRFGVSLERTSSVGSIMVANWRISSGCSSPVVDSCNECFSVSWIGSSKVSTSVSRGAVADLMFCWSVASWWSVGSSLYGTSDSTSSEDFNVSDVLIGSCESSSLWSRSDVSTLPAFSSSLSSSSTNFSTNSSVSDLASLTKLLSLASSSIFSEWFDSISIFSGNLQLSSELDSILSSPIVPASFPAFNSKPLSSEWLLLSEISGW